MPSTLLTTLVPSPHVIYSALIIASVARGGSPAWLRGFLFGWLAILCVAVVLVHQHHVADVAGSLPVAWVVWRALR